MKLDTLARENGDVQIILKGKNGKSNGGGHICAVCTHCNKEIVAPIYIKPETNNANMNGQLFHKGCLPWFSGAKMLNKKANSDDVEDAKKDEQRNEKSTKLTQLWNDFLGSHTLHGFHYCFDGELPLRRLFWSLLLIGAFALFSEKCAESVFNFFEFPFTTATLLQYEDKMDFPAVSLCNYNDARKTKMNGTTMDLKLKAKMAGLNYSQYNIAGEDMKTTLANAAHALSDMVISCSWKNEVLRSRCLENFTSFKDAQGDVCYTFNSPKNNSAVLTLNNTGESKGLVLTIDIQHFDYYFGVSEAGFKVILHDPHETPVKMQGYSVSPGFTTYFSLQKKVVSSCTLIGHNMCDSWILIFVF